MIRSSKYLVTKYPCQQNSMKENQNHKKCIDFSILSLEFYENAQKYALISKILRTPFLEISKVIIKCLSINSVNGNVRLVHM